MRLKIKSSFTFYFILWGILFLLGNYIGGFYTFLYLFLTFLILTDLIHYILSINSIYYYQQFSTEHPHKEQQIEYIFTIENRMKFIPCFITILYNESLKLNNNNPHIYPKKTSYIKTVFSLPYRGVYNVGIKEIICTDLLNIFGHVHFMYIQK